MICILSFICGIITNMKQDDMLQYSIDCPLEFSLSNFIETIERSNSTSMLYCYCAFKSQSDPSEIQYQNGDTEETLKCSEIDAADLRSTILSYVFMVIILIGNIIYLKVIGFLVDFEKHMDVNSYETSKYLKSILFSIVCSGAMFIFLSMSCFDIFWGALDWFLVGSFFQFTPMWYRTVGSLQIATLFGQDLMKTLLSILMVFWNAIKKGFVEMRVRAGKGKGDLAKTEKLLQTGEFSLESHATGNSGHVFAAIMLGAGIPLVYILISLVLFLKFFWEKTKCRSLTRFL